MVEFWAAPIARYFFAIKKLVKKRGGTLVFTNSVKLALKNCNIFI